MKKDRLFIIVMSIIVANLSFSLLATISVLVSNISNFISWTLVIVNVMAIFGCLWLIQTHRKMVRESKKESNVENNDSTN